MQSKRSKIIILNILAIFSGVFLIFTPRSCMFFHPDVEQKLLSKYVQDEEELEEPDQNITVQL